MVFIAARLVTAVCRVVGGGVFLWEVVALEVEAQLQKLLEGGACIQMHEPDVGTFAVGHAAFICPGEFKWCVPFPEDQHHTHFIEYAEARLVVQGIYIQFFNTAGTLLATIGPYQEFEYGDEGYGDLLAKWGAALVATPVTRERFVDFFKHA